MTKEISKLSGLFGSNYEGFESIVHNYDQLQDLEFAIFKGERRLKSEEQSLSYEEYYVLNKEVERDKAKLDLIKSVKGKYPVRQNFIAALVQEYSKKLSEWKIFDVIKKHSDSQDSEIELADRAGVLGLYLEKNFSSNNASQGEDATPSLDLNGSEDSLDNKIDKFKPVLKNLPTDIQAHVIDVALRSLQNQQDGWQNKILDYAFSTDGIDKDLLRKRVLLFENGEKKTPANLRDKVLPGDSLEIKDVISKIQKVVNQTELKLHILRAELHSRNKQDPVKLRKQLSEVKPEDISQHGDRDSAISIIKELASISDTKRGNLANYLPWEVKKIAISNDNPVLKKSLGNGKHYNPFNKHWVPVYQDNSNSVTKPQQVSLSNNVAGSGLKFLGGNIGNIIILAAILTTIAALGAPLVALAIGGVIMAVVGLYNGVQKTGECLTSAGNRMLQPSEEVSRPAEKEALAQPSSGHVHGPDCNHNDGHSHEDDGKGSGAGSSPEPATPVTATR